MNETLELIKHATELLKKATAVHDRAMRGEISLNRAFDQEIKLLKQAVAEIDEVLKATSPDEDTTK